MSLPVCQVVVFVFFCWCPGYFGDKRRKWRVTSLPGCPLLWSFFFFATSPTHRREQTPDIQSKFFFFKSTSMCWSLLFPVPWKGSDVILSNFAEKSSRERNLINQRVMKILHSNFTFSRAEPQFTGQLHNFQIASSKLTAAMSRMQYPPNTQVSAPPVSLQRKSSKAARKWLPHIGFCLRRCSYPWTHAFSPTL